MKWNLDNFVIIKIEEVTIVLHRWNVYFCKIDQLLWYICCMTQGTILNGYESNIVLYHFWLCEVSFITLIMVFKYFEHLLEIS